MENNNQNKKKYYSYCSIGRQGEIFATIEGIVLPIKIDTYKKADGVMLDRMNFAISSKNIADKIKHTFKVEPPVSKNNPENIFINCTAFGTTAKRLEQYVHERDTVIVSGVLTVYTSPNGSSRVNMVIRDVKVLKYANQQANNFNANSYNTNNNMLNNTVNSNTNNNTVNNDMVNNDMVNNNIVNNNIVNNNDYNNIAYQTFGDDMPF